MNRLLFQALPSGAIVASGGNAGIASAAAAGELGVHCEVFVPEVCSASKRARLAALGAQVVVGGALYADAVLVSVGGGGLIGGLASWFKARSRVVALEPELAPTLFRAREAGRPVEVAVRGMTADSLGASGLKSERVRLLPLVCRSAFRLLFQRFPCASFKTVVVSCFVAIRRALAAVFQVRALLPRPADHAAVV